MHALIASIFAAIFSFCHASVVHQSMSHNSALVAAPSGYRGYAPNHRELATQVTYYPERGCASCGMTTAVYSAR